MSDRVSDWRAPQHERAKIMTILWAIVIGFIVGLVAKFLMPGRDPGGFIVTTVVGIVGAVLATWIGRMAGWYSEGQSAGFIASVLGAILLLAIYRAVAGRRTLPA
jgi:uncharacterized membrane protein YeaQ/YmgE (transglycosylase-associated protein family)